MDDGDISTGSNLVAIEETMAIQWDAAVPGLGLRKNKRGAVWILKFRIDGKQIMKVLGPGDMLSRVEARVLAKTTKWDAKQGKLPKPKKKIQHISVEFFCEEYIEKHAKRRKKSWLKDDQRLKFHVLPAWSKRKISSIDQSDVAILFARVGATAPVAANRLLEVLHKMFKLAVSWNYYPTDQANPAANHDRYPENKNTRWLTKEELEAVAPLINALPRMRAVFFWMLLITGCRKSEILELKWSDVNLDEGYILVGVTKNGEPHCLPIPVVAINLLRELSRHSIWVFPGADPSKFWKRPDKIWRKILKQVELRGVTVHTLRHTTASRLLQKKYPLRIVGDVLNQRSLAATNRYAHLSKEYLREIMEHNASDLPSSEIA